MNELLIGLLGALLATNQLAAASAVVEKKTGFRLAVPDPNDPLEQEYQRLLVEDDRAQEEVDGWIKENKSFADKGAGVDEAILSGRIRQRLTKVRSQYEAFVTRHPDHGRARLAYGSFLMELDEEELGRQQWEKARELDPNNPAAWNNLANYYGHNSPVKKSFEYYAKAIELDPNETVYYHNFATTVYLFRSDAREFYKISEAEVFDKAMGLYAKAMELDPNNFILAQDVAQSYYGIPVVKTEDEEANRRAEIKHADAALAAWKRAMPLARDDVERQGVLMHFARSNINGRRFDEARQNLASVTVEMYAKTKETLLRKLNKAEAREKEWQLLQKERAQSPATPPAKP